MSIDAAPPVWRTAAGVVRLSFFLGWQDVRLMYRRSVLGQFWITLSMAVTFAAIGSVFGLIFNSPIVTYLPFLGCGLVFFNFISSILNEGAIAFASAEGFIRQLPLPPLTFFLRSVWRVFFILLHNAVALAVLLLVFPQPPSGVMLLVVPGLIVGGVGMTGLALALAMLSTRYRDVPQILGSIVGVSFYLTPIVWLPDAIPQPARDILLTWNPFTHMITVMRDPLLGVAPTWDEWASATGLAVVFVVLGTLAYAWKRRQLAFWV